MTEINEIKGVVNSLICKVDVDFHISENRNIQELMYHYEREIKRLKRCIHENEKKIYKTCEHIWEKDYDDYYSRYKICHKCKLANMPYVYTQ